MERLFSAKGAARFALVPLASAIFLIATAPVLRRLARFSGQHEHDRLPDSARSQLTLSGNRGRLAEPGPQPVWRLRSSIRARRSRRTERRLGPSFRSRRTPQADRHGPAWRWTPPGTSSSCGQLLRGRKIGPGFSPGDTTAPGTPVGGEFQVNTYTTGYQGIPRGGDERLGGVRSSCEERLPGRLWGASPPVSSTAAAHRSARISSSTLERAHAGSALGRAERLRRVRRCVDRFAGPHGGHYRRLCPALRRHGEPAGRRLSR